MNISLDRNNDKQIAFLCGTARSGTSALTNLLNSHPEILIGMERYSSLIRRHDLNEEHFKFPRFAEILPGDTHKYGNLQGGKDVTDRYKSSKIVGDKCPNLFNYYDYIIDAFNNAKFIYIIRNPLSVAESYQLRADNDNDTWLSDRDYKVAVKDWNDSVEKTVKLINMIGSDRICLVEYERAFSFRDSLDKILYFFGLSKPFNNKIVEQFFDKNKQLQIQKVPKRDDIRVYVAKNINWSAYHELLFSFREDNSSCHYS